jgi:hypothetical protein
MPGVSYRRQPVLGRDDTADQSPQTPSDTVWRAIGPSHSVTRAHGRPRPALGRMSRARAWPHVTGPRLAACHGPALGRMSRARAWPHVSADAWPEVTARRQAGGHRRALGRLSSARTWASYLVLMYHGGGGWRARRGPCVRNRVNFRVRVFRGHAFRGHVFRGDAFQGHAFQGRVGDSVDTRVLLSSSARALFGFRSPGRPIRRRSVVGRIRRRRADGGGRQELAGSASIPGPGTARKATRVAARTLRFRSRSAPLGRHCGSRRADGNRAEPIRGSSGSGRARGSRRSSDLGAADLRAVVESLGTPRRTRSSGPARRRPGSTVVTATGVLVVILDA